MSTESLELSSEVSTVKGHEPHLESHHKNSDQHSQRKAGRQREVTGLCHWVMKVGGPQITLLPQITRKWPTAPP
eukprot:675070-Pelagomonas_calceolata.AAC.1